MSDLPDSSNARRWWVFRQLEGTANYMSGDTAEHAVSSYCEMNKVAYGTRVYVVPADGAETFTVGTTPAKTGKEPLS